MSKSQRIAAPAGMSGIYVEPWSKGEIYAVAADWAQANSPVLVYGEDGWTNEEHGRQVADFRHSDRAALESVIREAIEMGGDEPDDDEVAGILEDATDCVSAELNDMATMLERHGSTFAGNCSTDTADDWIDNGFDDSSADSWCEIGCWDAATAAALRDADLTPEEARVAADKLIEASEDARDDYTDGDPIYSACNNDTPVQEIIDAAKE